MNIHNTVDTISKILWIVHTLSFVSGATAPTTGHPYNTTLYNMLLPRASLWTHPFAGQQRQHSNAVNVNAKERHRKLLHCNLQQDKSSSKSINFGLFKPRKQLLALGSICSFLSVNYNNDIWQCGNGGDQR